MKRYETESLGDILRKAIDESDRASRYSEIEAINLWPRIVGRDLANRTLRPTVRQGVMTIKVPAAALRHELNMMRTSLANAMNRELGKDVISEIKFI